MITTNNIRTDPDEKVVEIYCAGLCPVNQNIDYTHNWGGNWGEAGYGSILKYNGNSKTVQGYEEDSSSMRIKLVGVVKALEEIKSPSKIIVYTDSKIFIDAATKWIKNWLYRNWRQSSNREVHCKVTWQKLLALSLDHLIQLKYKTAEEEPKLEDCYKLAKQSINGNSHGSSKTQDGIASQRGDGTR